MRLVQLVVILVSFASACDGPSKPTPTGVQKTAEREADFVRMATAGKMLSNLQTYLVSGDPAPKTFTFDRLDFDPNSAAVRPIDQPTIHTLAISLQNHPNVRIRIIGFGDGERTRGDNNLLAMQRATAIILALRNAGVEPTRLEAAAGREGNRQRATQLVVLQK